MKRESKRLSLSKTTIAQIDGQEVYGGYTHIRAPHTNCMGTCVDCPQPFTLNSCLRENDC
jgi:hypothetical protein